MKTKNIVKAVLFDFGGVFAEEGFRKGLRLIAESSNVDSDLVEDAGFKLMYSTGYVLGKGVENDFWQAIKKQTGITGDNLELRNLILKNFVIRPWFLETVKQLKGAGTGLYILSDQTDWLDKLNDRDDFYQYFDHIFNSYYMGISKSEAELFDIISEKLELPPDEILFVDDYAGHIERAEKKGFHTHLFINKKGFMTDLKKYFILE